MQERLSPERRKARRHKNEEVREGLRIIFTPPVEGHLRRVKGLISDSPDFITRMAASCQVYEIPYSVAALPDDLFNYCGSDGRPILLDTEEKVDRHMKEFWPHHVDYYMQHTGIGIFPQRSPNEWNDTWEELYAMGISHAAFDSLSTILKKRLNTPVDPHDWERYQEVAKQQQQKGDYYLGFNAYNMGRTDLQIFPTFLHEGTTALFEILKGKNASFLLTRNVSPFSAAIATIRVPVGEGKMDYEHVDSIIRSAWVQANLIEYDRELSSAIEAEMSDPAKATLVGKKTLRAYALPWPVDSRPRPAVRGTIASLHEGNLSVWSAFRFLTNPIPQDGSLSHLTEKVLRQDKVNSLARFAPLNLVGGVTPLGTYAPDVVQEDVNGELLFNPTFVRAMDGVNETDQKQIYADLEALDNGVDPRYLSPAIIARTGERGCPLGFLSRSTRRQRRGSSKEQAVITQTMAISGNIYQIVTATAASSDVATPSINGKEIADKIQEYSAIAA